MKRLKRILPAVLAMLMALGLMIPGALASGNESESVPPTEAEKPQPSDGKCDLTLNFKVGEEDAKKPAEGVTFSLYKVGDVYPDLVKFQPDENYAAVLLDTKSNWAQKAGTLKWYVVYQDKKTADFTATTDADGVAKFTEQIPDGIYLVLGTETGVIDGQRYNPAPALMTFPAFNTGNNRWDVRDVNASVKSIGQYLAVDISWDDHNYSGRPGSLVVELVRDDKVIHEVTINSGDSWYYKWADPWGDLEVRIKDSDQKILSDKEYNKNSFGLNHKTQDDPSRTMTYYFNLTRDDPGYVIPESPPPTTNKESVHVVKQWLDDDASMRPSSVTVDLVNEDGVYSTVELSRSNNWNYTWSNLDEGDWQVVEHSTQGYTVSYSSSGSNRVITNTYSQIIVDPDPPLVDMDDPDVPLDPGTPETPVTPPDTDLGDPDVPLDPGEPTTPIAPPDTDLGDPEIPLMPGDPVPPANPVPVAPPDTEIPEEEPPLVQLPQTGVLWWPVPIMALLGAALVLMGYARRRHSEF